MAATLASTALVVASPGAPRAPAAPFAPAGLELDVDPPPPAGRAPAPRPRAACAPFATSCLVPADASVYIHVVDAASLRRDLARRPIARGLMNVLGAGQLRAAWNDLAAAAGESPEGLFDIWLGRRVTLAVRTTPDGRRDWALLCDVDAKTAQRIIERLEPKRLAPRFEVTMVELPEHDLRIAGRRGRWVIGPTPPAGMFDHVVATLGGRHFDETLATDASLATARTLGAGRFACFVRHDPFIGGFSALVADVRGDRLHLRHTARFEAPPFQRPCTALRYDMSPIRALEGGTLLAMIEPTDIGAGPAELFGQALLGHPLVSEEMRTNLGPTRILAFGEVEGRQEDPRRDLLKPTSAVIMRIEDAADAEAQLDRHFTQMARALEDRTGAAIVIPRLDALRSGAPRSIDIRPALLALKRQAPLLESVTLNWAVARAPIGAYYVVASHPDLLRESVARLEAAAPAPVAEVDRWTSCGTLDGRRLGVHLRAYSDQAHVLAHDVEGEETMRQTFLMLSELAAGIDRCRWRVRRPQAETMRLEVEIDLSAPESSDPR